MSTVGSRIREARESKGWTQDDLAQRLSTSRTLVSSWEGDKTVPRGGTRLKIANAMDVSTEWLRVGTGLRDLPADGEEPRNPETAEAAAFLASRSPIKLYEQFLIPAYEVTLGYLQEHKIELGEEPLAKVVISLVMKCMNEKRNPEDFDVQEALVRVIKGE